MNLKGRFLTRGSGLLLFCAKVTALSFCLIVCIKPLHMHDLYGWGIYLYSACPVFFLEITAIVLVE